MPKHSRDKVRAERVKHEQRRIERLKWREAFIPPDPNHTTKHYQDNWFEYLIRRTKSKDRTPCSCYLCGNLRRHFGVKCIQERRLDDHDLYDD